MTTYATVTKKCAHCGAKVKCDVLNSTNEFGSPDLDLRPAEMARSTMGTWLQQCPHCHFVNSDLNEPLATADQLLASEAYRKLINDAGIPELAKRFACYALLVEGADPMGAAEATLRAAWACDDADDRERAARFRSQSADYVLAKLPVVDRDAQLTLRVRLVDILRRASRFDEAKMLLVELKADPEVIANKILAAVVSFEAGLCAKADVEGYTIAAAMGEEES